MNVLFDLDGTLTNSELGITSCIAHALEKLGLPVPPRSDLRRFIGPPLRSGFTSLLGTSDDAMLERAMALYRGRFSEVGLYENELYADTLDTLQRLASAGHQLFVATSKPAVFATRIVAHFGLDQYFLRVYGAGPAGEHSDKTHLLAHILAAEQLSPTRTVMVGDRHHDVTGARANRVTSVAVLWGYAAPDELRDADHVVATWPALLECIQALESKLDSRTDTLR